MLALLVLVPACYSTQPLGSVAPGPETRILGRLTGQASSQMEPLIGRDAVAIEGIVVATRDNEWDVRVLRVDQTGERSVRWNGEVVTFPAGAFSSVAGRKLEKGRTALFAGGLTTGLILVARAIGLAGFFADGGGGGPTPIE